MSLLIQRTGFTVLQDCDGAELDIVFVHGLEGHPQKSWTYRNVDTETNHPRGLLRIFTGKNTKASKSRSPSPASELVQSDIFWPRDLLSNHESCQKARIMTYGYDSDINKMMDTANFTTITAEGQSLLNAIARKRVDHTHRPLMFIAHSLGGLIVKSVRMYLKITRTLV